MQDALGMGNAFNALSDDASASYFNPAGSGLIKKMELSGGLSFNKTSKTHKSFLEKMTNVIQQTHLSTDQFVLPSN